MLFSANLSATSMDIHLDVTTDGPSFEETVATILNDTIVDLDDTIFIQLSDCSARGEVCLGIPPSEGGNFQYFNNGATYTGGFLACDFDTITVYTYTNLFGQGNSGPYNLQSWMVNGEIFSGAFENINDLVDSMNLWDPMGNWEIDPTLELISGGNNSSTYTDMVIFVVQLSTVNIVGLNQNFEAQGSLLFFDIGFNELAINQISNGCKDTVRIMVACIPSETINIDTLFAGVTDTFCLDFSELQAPLVSVTNICTTDGNVDFQFVNGETCVEYTTLAVGVDSACIVACDQLGFCDTTYIIVDVQDPNPSRVREFFDTVFVNQLEFLCFDTTMLANVDTFYSNCNNGGDNVFFVLDTASLCISYRGLESGGIDTFCLIICDDAMVCDSNFVYIKVNREGPAYAFDTIYVNQESSFCDFDMTNLNGPITNIVNGCPGTSGTFVNFSEDLTNFCMDYTAIDVGQDTACVFLTDSEGGVDTTFLIVNVLEPTTEVIFDTIRLANTVEYCLDTLQLGPNVLDTIFFCEEFTGTAVNFDANNVSLCINVEAITAGGTDTICVFVCDELLSCDTTKYIISVDDETITTPPIANPDSDTTSLNTTLILDVCTNDIVPENNVTNFFVLPEAAGGVGPQRGIAFGTDCSINYIPEPDSCGLDSFTYVICNPIGCDTTNVTVLVECMNTSNGDFEIFNGFSPNGDLVNDFFRIDGLQDFPNHIVYVFNRWGNEVLKTENYNNDWAGTWNGTNLPDGTYFYVFDPGNGEATVSGYVQINR